MKTKALAAKLLVGAVVAVASIVSPISASATSGGVDPELIDSLTVYWSDHGVSSETQENLIDGIHAGISPQSMAEGSVPVSSHSFDADGQTTSVSVYADGSISTSSVEIATPVSPYARGISGCSVATYTGVTYYTNCLITGSNGTVSLSFYASVTIQHTSWDLIVDTGEDPRRVCALTSCSAPWMNGYKAWENSAGRAYLTYSVTASDAVSTGTFHLTLSVGANGRYTSFG